MERRGRYRGKVSKDKLETPVTTEEITKQSALCFRKYEIELSSFSVKLFNEVNDTKVINSTLFLTGLKIDRAL
jgi:hypothetical protein